MTDLDDKNIEIYRYPFVLSAFIPIMLMGLSVLFIFLFFKVAVYQSDMDLMGFLFLLSFFAFGFLSIASFAYYLYRETRPIKVIGNEFYVFIYFSWKFIGKWDQDTKVYSVMKRAKEPNSRKKFLKITFPRNNLFVNEFIKNKDQILNSINRLSESYNAELFTISYIKEDIERATASGDIVDTCRDWGAKGIVQRSERILL